MTESSSSTGSLSLGSVAPAGRALLLQPGDCLVAVNGLPFAGSPADLAARFQGGPVALTFRRGETEITLLGETSALGKWEVGPALPETPRARLHPEVLCNWEVLAGADGTYDLHPLRPSLAALVLPPVWMLQMRLWGLAAALTAAVALGFAVAPWVALAIYVPATLHVWRAGPAYVRADRALRGMTPVAVLAARGETEAHAAYARLAPRARFVFARAAGAPEPAGA